MRLVSRESGTIWSRSLDGDRGWWWWNVMEGEGLDEAVWVDYKLL